MSSPASPSGNRHDGVLVYHDGGGWFRRMNAPSEVFEMYVAHPVDIDAARTAVIEAAQAVQQADEVDVDPDALEETLEALYIALDALTTKGATT